MTQAAAGSFATTLPWELGDIKRKLIEPLHYATTLLLKMKS